jgi:hypothetical protein
MAHDRRPPPAPVIAARQFAFQGYFGTTACRRLLFMRPSLLREIHVIVVVFIVSSALVAVGIAGNATAPPGGVWVDLLSKAGYATFVAAAWPSAELVSRHSVRHTNSEAAATNVATMRST